MSLLSQTNSPLSNTFYWNATSGGGGGGGTNVPSIVAVASNVWWTQQTWIPGSSQEFRPELGGTNTSNGSVIIPAAIRTGLANSNYTTLRIDHVFPILEDQGDVAGGTGRYWQTALAAAGLDVSANMCFPATQFHMILNQSGTGVAPADVGLFLANTGPCFPYSLVLNKSNLNITASSALVEFQLSTTSTSNAKFYLGSATADLSNVCPMVFTLTA